MNVYIPGGLATRGPCDIGYHIPSKDEWVRIRAVMITLSINNASGYGNNLKLPRGDCRDYNLDAQYNGYYRTADKGTSPVSWADCMQILDNIAGVGTLYRGAGLAIRPFKDSYIVPDSTWEVLQGALGSIGIFYNSNRGLISISEDGTTGITIADKNLGATNVYNSGDALSEANCGKFYQWGNNYGFPYTGAVTTSSTKVDASGYGPGNYYSSSTFITGSSDWSSVQNDNLRGGEDGNVQVVNELKNAYIGEVWTPGNNTIAYYPLNSTTTVNDMSGNNRNLTNNGTQFGTYAGVNCAYFPSSNTRKLYGSLPLSGTQNFTFNVWVNRVGNNAVSGSNPNTNSQIINLGNTGTSSAQFGIAIQNSNSALNPNKYVAWSWGTDKLSSTTNTMNTWYMITVTHQSGAVKVYVNTTLIIDQTINFNIANTNFTAGSFYNDYNSNYQNFYGYMSELIAESAVWTATEVLNYYNNTKSNYGL